MKRKILASILGVAALSAASTVHGQGKINLNNYSNSGNPVVYGGGLNAIPGTVAGHGIQNGAAANGAAGNVTWTIGFYYALGDVTASVTPDSSGFGIPSGGGLAVASGAPGDTATINNSIPGGGYFTSFADALISGWTAGSMTLEIVAYTGADYASSPFRGHSAAFLLTPIASTAPQAAPPVSFLPPGSGMPGFAVFSVPEPSTFALAGLGAAALLGFRRKK